MQPSNIAELIIRRMTQALDGPHGSAVQRKAFALLRRLIVAQGDKYIRYKLGGGDILLPLAHNLPLIRASFPQYSTNIGRLCSYVSEKYPDLRLVDIGANVGDTVAIVRERSQCPILCVEGDEYYFNILSENIRRAKFVSVEAVHALVASHTGEIKGQMVSTAGTAHFVEDNRNLAKVIRLSHLLKDFPEFQAPKILKIDTDGFDCSILSSELEWLGGRKPVLFFEYDPYLFSSQPYDGTRIFADLSTIGYTFAIFYDNFGDYLTSVDLQRDTPILDDLQNYYLGRGGQQYLDVAVFHAEDDDLAGHVRMKEAEWSLRLREERSRGSHPS